MNDTKKTALEIFDRLPPKAQQLINAYIDALATAPEKERKLLLSFTDALTATIGAGELPEGVTVSGYLQSALELVIVARTGGSGSRTAWGIIRATIEEAQERQAAADFMREGKDLKEPMKNADYYIDAVLFRARSVQDMQQIKPEIDEWYSAASSDERRKFTESGAAEALEMSCS